MSEQARGWRERVVESGAKLAVYPLISPPLYRVRLHVDKCAYRFPWNSSGRGGKLGGWGAAPHASLILRGQAELLLGLHQPGEQ